MTPAERLVRRAAACGYRVRLTADGPTLEATRAEAFLPVRLLADLKANRAAVVAHLEGNPLPADLCAVCERDVTDPEDRARLVDPAFCDTGGSRGNRDHPASPRCPYKGNCT